MKKEIIEHSKTKNKQDLDTIEKAKSVEISITNTSNLEKHLQIIGKGQQAASLETSNSTSPANIILNSHNPSNEPVRTNLCGCIEAISTSIPL